jgi:hypothetical protein
MDTSLFPQKMEQAALPPLSFSHADRSGRCQPRSFDILLLSLLKRLDVVATATQRGGWVNRQRSNAH